ncbi:hypothetical protein CY34DRAFT_433568 [Suillus luteus UH-Slu-Lm8-n1]|uniref:Uncharacterized protein n=1 Tax=Suillus luteus UH-Slu-Lm8-n1 TaxID=930992 RepID=A0A0D0B4V3_9AGAM|nr:hypothetical protein CY34DRAFT_433568 [Suillus luteus UH-Slu-Lm8-n1]
MSGTQRVYAARISNTEELVRYNFLFINSHDDQREEYAKVSDIILRKAHRIKVTVTWHWFYAENDFEGCGTNVPLVFVPTITARPLPSPYGLRLKSVLAWRVLRGRRISTCSNAPFPCAAEYVTSDRIGCENISETCRCS